MEPGSPLLIPPGDGREGKIIISAVERRDGKKILIWRAGSRDGIGKYNYGFFRNFRSFSVGFGRFSRFRLFSCVFVFFWLLQAFSVVSVIFNGFRSFDFVRRFSTVFTFLYSQEQVWQKLESYNPLCIPDLPNLANTNSRLAQLSPSSILQVDAKK